MLSEADILNKLEGQVDSARRSYHFWKATVYALVGLSILYWGSGCLVNQQRRSSGTRPYVECYSNLKNMGTAMEIYSTDWSGKYPPALDNLTPNYLKELPECRAAGSMSYKAQFGPNTQWNTPGFQDYYLLWCDGGHHPGSGAPQGFPFYDGITGLTRKPDDLR